MKGLLFAFWAWIKIAWPVTIRVVVFAFSKIADGQFTRREADEVLDMLFKGRESIRLWGPGNG